jgi:hypothetical protein
LPFIKHPPALRLILWLTGTTLLRMRKTILSAMLLAALAAPALAQSYPVSGP